MAETPSEKVGVVSKIKLLFFLAKLLQFLFGGGPGGMFPGKMPFSFQCMNTFCAIFWRSGGSPARCSKSHFFAAEQQFSAKLARSITVVEQELAGRAPNRTQLEKRYAFWARNGARNSRKGVAGEKVEPRCIRRTRTSWDGIHPRSCGLQLGVAVTTGWSWCWAMVLC